jgi:integrase
MHWDLSMDQNMRGVAAARDSEEFPTSGWTIKDLRIGKVRAGCVHIHDMKGAHQFREFVESTFELVKRRRQGRNATRYLEELSNPEAPRLLSEEASDYLAEMKRLRKARSTQYSQKHHFRLLLLAAGDIPVSRIGSAHIREFWEVLRWWPEDAGWSKKKYEGMTDAQILACGKAQNREPRADSTMDLARTQISAFLNGLVKRRVIASSPMVSFRDPRKSLVNTPKRRPFKAEEIVKIFDPETFLPWARKAPHAWWAPMIGLYTGARVGEVAQLKVADIIQDCGIWCFSIRVTEDSDGGVSQSLKGASAVRVIPIAQPLLDAGFLDFLEDARDSGHARLFPQLKMGCKAGTQERNGVGYGQALCRLFSIHLKRSMSIQKGLAFHCFRHNLVTELTVNKVEPRVIASITGHLPKQNRREVMQFPVMEGHYTHVPTPIIRPEQVAALATFSPPVSLPVYQRGQFAHCFGKNAKKYP